MLILSYLQLTIHETNHTSFVDLLNHAPNYDPVRNQQQVEVGRVDVCLLKELVLKQNWFLKPVHVYISVILVLREPLS